jgi:hypothetical protein
VSGIVQPAFQDFLRKARSTGKVIDNEAEALAQVTASPQWKDVLLPAIQRTCTCAAEKFLSAIREATSAQEIMLASAALRNLPSNAEGLKSMEATARRCAEESLLPALGSK